MMDPEISISAMMLNKLIVSVILVQLDRKCAIENEIEIWQIAFYRGAWRWGNRPVVPSAHGVDTEGGERHAQQDGSGFTAGQIKRMRSDSGNPERVSLLVQQVGQR